MQHYRILCILVVIDWFNGEEETFGYICTYVWIGGREGTVTQLERDMQ